MCKKLQYYLNTIIYLKPTQIFYRLFYFFRRRKKIKKIKNSPKISYKIALIASIASYPSYINKKTFRFINLAHTFNEKINWNYTDHGMLWTYNLNYFEFLHQDTIDKETGLSLMLDYVDQDKDLRIGYDSYPISLRNIFWIRFLAMNQIKNERIDAFLYKTYAILLQNLEFHLLGNHLMENAFSLLFGAYYFRDTALYRKAYKLLKSELKEQLLNDGSHFELSPMYHQILLHRLMDCYNVVSNNKWIEDDLPEFMHSKCAIMLSWLKNMTFPSGNIPFLNDASGNIAPSSSELFSYAERLGIAYTRIPLSDSNYRLFSGNRYTLICDIGGISPSYQCGHSHADTFNFVMEVDNYPFFVDTGCSTYQIGEIRMFERGTPAHNTVVVNGENSSQVWASHRVGKRAKIFIVEDTPHCITVKHNGYKGVIHSRTFKHNHTSIEIIDRIRSNEFTSKNVALFHFDHSIKNISILGDTIVASSVKIFFEGSSFIYLDSYEQAIGFNKRINSKCICVDFDKLLRTTITILHL